MDENKKTVMQEITVTLSKEEYENLLKSVIDDKVRFSHTLISEEIDRLKRWYWRSHDIKVNFHRLGDGSYRIDISLVVHRWFLLPKTLEFRFRVLPTTLD